LKNIFKKRITRIHVVTPYDTLESIAQKYYADRTKWRGIAKANNIEDPRRLEPGTTLIIPRLDDEDEDKR